MHSLKIQDENLCYWWGSSSTLVFFALNFMLRYLTPQSASEDVHQRWKWRNTANSLLHSTISGIWSFLCVWQIPEMRQDLISEYAYSAHAALSVSAGYFTYDLIDMVLGHRKRSSYELMVHHILVILCFGLAISTRSLLGFCIFGLLVEVNSVFLHARQLMHLQNINRQNGLYRINSVLNVGTFVVFRLMTIGILCKWVFELRHKLTTIAYIFGMTTLPTLFAMNAVLFLRVLNTDFLKRRSDTKLTQLLLHETEDWRDEHKND
ncbi:hypothetical protein R5R35_007153 [Gryllus longicercus]|uniref:TLC domain-containing protein n=1 Tax=Gryllus longicercus TaxID=2509291 RepID=A0AAN9YVJ5_9ORTH